MDQPADATGRDLASVADSPGFRRLLRARGRLGLAVVALIVGIYFGYLALLAFAPGLMRTPLDGVITPGFPLGLGVIALTIGLVAFYVRRARRDFDPLVAALRGEAGR